MRYSLRALLIVMLLGGPLCDWGWRWWEKWRKDEQLNAEAMRQFAAAVEEMELAYPPPNQPSQD